MDIFEAISAVLNQSQSKEQQELFDNWLSKSNTNKRLFEYLSQVKLDAKNKEIRWDKEKIWQITQNKIHLHSIKKSVSVWRAVAAASIALLISVGSLLYLNQKPNFEKTVTLSTQTPYGIKTQVNLADGSTVYLNSGSSLTYLAEFDGKERHVALEGEAYFDIAKDPKHPFIVNTDSIDIRVLGTKFNVKGYREDAHITTTLVEGSVSINRISDDSAIVLTPNQQASYEKNSKKITSQNVDDASSYIAWLDNEYYFEDQTFEEILKQLERGFNVRFIIEDESLKEEKFTGQFDSNESISNILEIMKLKRDFDYYLDGNTYHINKKN